MSPEAYSWDVRESAEELYIIDGRTYTEVAEATGVSVAQLKRWGTDSAPTWSERRREYRQAQTSVRRGVMLAKAKLIKSVIKNEDPQKAYAFSSLVSSGKVLDVEARERMQSVDKEDPLSLSLGTDSVDINTALHNAIERKIGVMLSQPGGITMATIKELQQSLILLEKLKAKAEAGMDKEDRQLDEATIKNLREEFGL